MHLHVSSQKETVDCHYLIACFKEGVSLPHQYPLHVVGFCGGGRALRLRLRLRLPATKEAGVVLYVDHDDLDGGDDDGEQRDEDDHDAHAKVVLVRLAHARVLENMKLVGAWAFELWILAGI